MSDDEWAFSAPYLTLMTEDAPQREVFNGLRWLVRTGAPWRMLPHDLPPWYVVYQQTQRWLKGGVFEAMVQDLQELLRVTAANEQGLAQVAALTQHIQAVTSEHVELAYVDEGYSGDNTAQAAAQHGIHQKYVPLIQRGTLEHRNQP